MDASQLGYEGNVKGRCMSIDLGKARVGVALSDLNGILATPHSTFKRISDEDLLTRLIALADAEDVSTIVVGIPKSLSSKNAIAENEANSFIAKLSERTNRRIVGIDERFTTVLASQRLRELGHDSRSMKTKLDSMAAAEILQSYLDSRDNSK